MIGKDEAVEFATQNFPNAPEKFVEHFGISVKDSRASGSDGWCLQLHGHAIIRVSSCLSNNAKRFTLAHEIAHLILGIPATFGETFEEMIASDKYEERLVNDLAAELLMPLREAKRDFNEPPIVAAALRRFAKRAGVSELSAAIRVCNLVEELGLTNASVVSFSGDDVRWQWSKTLRMTTETAVDLLVEARESSPHAYRADYGGDQTIVASVLDNPHFGSATLFVQLLPKHLGEVLSFDERRRQFEDEHVNPIPKFRAKVQGIFGAFKPKCQGMTIDQAEELFWEQNQERLGETPIGTAEGRAYVRLRLEQFLL